MRPIDRWIGMKPQFRSGNAGDVYREDGYGAPIPVTAAERDAFIRAGTRAFVWHVAGFTVATVAAALMVGRLFASGNGVGRAAITAVIASVIGALLFASYRWATRAPARALAAAGRRPIGPPEPPALTRWPSYPTIIGGVLIGIFAVAQSIRSTPQMITALSIVFIATGLGVAVLKWRGERGFTPAQKAAAKAQRRAERSRFSFGLLIVFLIFAVVELVLMLVAFGVTMDFVFKSLGSSWDDPTPLAFVLGLIAGFTATALVTWPLERLCRRWTGTSPGDFMSQLPI